MPSSFVVTVISQVELRDASAIKLAIAIPDVAFPIRDESKLDISSDLIVFVGVGAILFGISCCAGRKPAFLKVQEVN